MKKIVDMYEVVLMCYVEVWIGFYGLWSHEGFIKNVWVYGTSYVHFTNRLRLGNGQGLRMMYMKESKCICKLV